MELHPEEVPDFTKDTVLHDPKQLAIRVTDPNVRAQKYWTVDLEAGSRKRDIFQIGDAPANPAALVFPPDIYKIRTEHARLNSPV